MMNLLVILPLLLPAFDGRVILRDRTADPIANVVAVDAAGVKVSDGGSERVIPWQRVMSVEGPLSGAAGSYLPQGEELWRAFARLGRGDLPAAEAMLERIKGELAQAPGPTSEAIWLGLMRCRLERGAQTAAVAAWLSWTQVRVAGSSEASTFALPPAMTPDAVGLIPALPPIWINTPSVAVVGSAGVDPWRIDTQSADSPGKILKAWYIRAARGACEMSGGPWPAQIDDRRVQFVAAVVTAQYGDDSERLAARELLKAMMTQRSEPWVEAWVRVAMGRSLLKETDPELKRLGVVELLHVPARLETVVPYLTGVALAESAAALRGMGDLESATRLREELVRKFAGHPSMEWAPVRDWPSAAARTHAASEAAELPDP